MANQALRVVRLNNVDGSALEMIIEGKCFVFIRLNYISILMELGIN